MIKTFSQYLAENSLNEGITWTGLYRGNLNLGLLGKTAKIYPEAAQTSVPDIIKFVETKPGNQTEIRVWSGATYNYDDESAKRIPAGKKVGDNYTSVKLNMHHQYISRKGVAHAVYNETSFENIGWDSMYPTYLSCAGDKWYNTTLIALIRQEVANWLAANPETPRPAVATQKPVTKTDFK